MPTTQINQLTVDEIVKSYPEALREPVQWLFGYMATACENNRLMLSARFSQVGHPYDQSYIYKLFTGQIHNPKNGQIGDRQVANITEAIEALRSTVKGPLVGRGIPPVETEVVRMVRDAIDTARRPDRVCKWVFISAPTGRQKTYSTGWYKGDHNHGSTIMLEAPDRPIPGYLVAELATAVCSAYAKEYYRKVALIRRNLNASKCIIIDNAQRLYNPRSGQRQDCFSLLQKLQDEIGFTLVLIFVRDVIELNGRKVERDFIADEMLNGESSGFFSQLIGRIGGLQNVLRLPDETCDEDLIAFARACGMSAEGARVCLPILRHLDRSTGNIRVLLQTLQNAADVARAARAKELTPAMLCDEVPRDTLDHKQLERLDALIAKINPQEVS